MPKNRLILICDSHRPRVHGGGCCSDKGSTSLQEALEELLQVKNLSPHVEVRSTGCMRNCRQGISVKVMPDNLLYGKVKMADLPQIVEQHLENDQPVDRLLAEETPRYFSF